MRRLRIWTAGLLACGLACLPPASTPATTPEQDPHRVSPGAVATASVDASRPARSAPTEPAWDPSTDCEGAKEGQVCPPEAGYCVLDWGEPGGHSEALWCTEGRWQLERETNLP